MINFSVFYCAAIRRIASFCASSSVIASLRVCILCVAIFTCFLDFALANFSSGHLASYQLFIISVFPSYKFGSELLFFILLFTVVFLVDEAVEIAYNALFANMGQCCCADTRSFVQEGMYEDLYKRSAERAQKRGVGDPFDEKTDHGPQIDHEQFTKILDLIESGLKQGARLPSGGKRKGQKGFFVEPIDFADVTDDMRIAHDEIFGHFMQMLKFAQQEKAGSVWVNCYDNTTSQTPFGGFKMSGQGRELGEDGSLEYMKIKTVTIKIQNKNS